MDTNRPVDIFEAYQWDKAKIAEAERHASAARRRERQRWVQMLSRCYSPSHRAYKNYGGRGIRVYQPWRDFDTFFADVGPCPGPGLSLDRIDNDGDYEPGNVRWATPREQSLNTRKAGGGAGSVSIIQVRGKWRALVRISRAKTFASRAEAEAWGEAVRNAIGDI
jgi:hypothetical protein